VLGHATARTRSGPRALVVPGRATILATVLIAVAVALRNKFARWDNDTNYRSGFSYAAEQYLSSPLTLETAAMA
jgi:hypothetical protein